MKTTEIGYATTEVTIENLQDYWAANSGLCAAKDVRQVHKADAVVATNATLLSLPTGIIRELGLAKTGSRHVVSRNGRGEADMYEAVRLTIQGRTCTMDVLEVSNRYPVLIGQLPLAHLDLVVDDRSRTLTGNPAHGGEHIYDL